jgi:hypothetical protein
MLGWVRGGAEVAVRGVALPYLLGLRWLDRRGRETGVAAAGGGDRMVRFVIVRGN